MSLSILSFKPGHDGSIAHVHDEQLKFSLEAEKDSFPRYYSVTPDLFLKAISLVDSQPDVLCVSGWVRGFHSIEPPLWAGYYGYSPSQIIAKKGSFFGKTVELFSSTHERSHLLCGYGLSPFEQGEPCYALVWEGNIGDFYEIDSAVQVHHLGRILEDPGNKYSFLFSVGDSNFPPLKSHFRFEDAGKLMALAAFSDRKAPSPEEQRVIDFILSRESILLSTPKEALSDYQVYNSGVESDIFKSLAGKLSDAIFDCFYRAIKEKIKKKLPLIITGGCGLNCEWNSKWRDCGLFRDVFVPPCTNDTGSAIGTAIDAQLFYERKAKVRWTVYSGTEFEKDVPIDPHFERRRFSYSDVADFLRGGNVVAWVQGRYEMGPRALGNRSILANPLDPFIRDRLNRIKERESYRPIAPVCLEDEISRLSDSSHPSPHMLYFYRVTSSSLPAVTHVDCSARFQTVNQHDNDALFQLLQSFKDKTGFGVLCNTSLNFKGKGFINRTSDLVKYCLQSGIDGFVIGDEFYARPHGVL
jgi:predicted NodU family carbamoyl transferase